MSRQILSRVYVLKRSTFILTKAKINKIIYFFRILCISESFNGSL